jgi:ketosteroid isomerase-like protein
MKRLLLITLLIAITIVSAVAQSPRTSGEQEVLRLQAAFYQAYAKGDSASIDRLLAADYTHNDLRGGLKDRMGYMAYIDSVASAIKSGTVKIDSSGLDDLRVRVYGDTAVATGRWSASGAKEGSDQDSEQLRFTYVWVKGAGRWKAVAGQVTPITAK